MKNTNKNIFEFSHIDKSLSECDIETLKDFYKHYHQKTGVLRNRTRDINFLMKQCYYLE